ncbi:hypothetical protein V2J09_019553 [Rumex salicifolius]
MEDEGISAPSVAEPQPPSSPHHGDAGVESASKENLLVDSQPSDEDGIDREDEKPLQSAESIEDLRAKIVKQVEYYFSDENLPNDKFLLKHIKKDKVGYVSIGLISSFRKIKKLTKDTAVIIEALKESSLLVVSPDEKKVRRLHPLPLGEFKDPNPKLCTVLVENLPENHSKENIKRIFGQVGSIKSICICDPHAAEDLKQNIKAEKPFSYKLHALVEYETVEAAKKAAVTLNDEKDWRNGLRVQLLQKRIAYSSGGKAWKGSDADKGSHTRSAPAVDENNHRTSESHDDTHEVQDGENISKEKEGRRSQTRRSKAQKHRGNSGMGHGCNTSSAHMEAAKPPPGPRMPDGTKGFAMGRGRPLVSTQV